MDIPTKFLLSFLLHLSYCSGIPGAGVPQKYHMLSKNDTGVVLMPESEQTLMDASVEVVDGQTIMKFTKIMKETGGDTDNLRGEQVPVDVRLKQYPRISFCQISF